MRALFWTMTLIAALLPAALFAQPAGKPGSRVLAVDRIVAVVNDEVITKLELAEQLKVTADTLRRQGTPVPPLTVLEKQVLERIIATKTQLHFAKESGLKIDDAMVETTIERIAQN